MSSFPYVDTSNVFNTANYDILEDGLTLEQANKLYLLSGGNVNGTINTSIINSNQYNLSGSPINFSAISGITNGVPAASKALTLDSSSVISGTMIQRIDTNQAQLVSSNATEYPLLIRRITTTTGDRNCIAFLNTTTAASGTTPAGTIGFVRNSQGNGSSDFSLCMRMTSTTTDPVVEKIRINAVNNTMQLLSSSVYNPGNGNGNAPISASPIHCYASSSYLAFNGNTNWNTLFSATGTGSAGYTFGLACSNGNSHAYPWQLGSMSSGGLMIVVNGGTNALGIANNGYVAVTNGSTAASYPLEILLGGALTSVSNYGVIYNTGASYSQLGPNSFYIAFRCGDLIRAGGVVLSSDRRIKKNFRPITDEMVENFMNKCIPCIYDLRKNDSTQLGWIAQDVAKAGFHGLLSMDEPNEEMEVENPEEDIPGRLMSINYERIPAILQLKIMKQQKEIDELKQVVKKLEQELLKIHNIFDW